YDAALSSLPDALPISVLLQGMSRASVYLGLDIDPRMIRQCREAVTDPRAQFSLVSGASPFYALGNTDEGRDLSEVCGDRKSTRLNSSHQIISYAVLGLKKQQVLTAAP